MLSIYLGAGLFLMPNWVTPCLRLVFYVSIVITLILKLTNIYFKTNDLLECVVKLAKFHKTQVGEKGKDWQMIKLEELLKIKGK